MRSTGDLSKKEWASLFFVGARQQKQTSAALPRHAYMDPSNTVLFESEHAEIEKQRAIKRAKNRLPK